MLPLLANQLHISLSSKQVALVMTSALGKPLLQKHVRLPQEQQGDAAYDDLLTSLDQLLAQEKIKAGTPLHMTLASEYVRYLSLPPQDVVTKQSEKQAYARAAMQEVYGYAVSDWQIQCDDVPPEKPTVAVAIDQVLIDALQTLAKKHHLKLRTLQPFLMRAYNHLSKRIGQQNDVLTVVEESRVLCVQLMQGYCEQIRQFPRSEQWQDELQAWLTRGALMSEKSHHEVMLYAPTETQVTIRLSQPWQLKRMKATNKLAAQYAMLEAAL